MKRDDAMALAALAALAMFYWPRRSDAAPTVRPSSPLAPVPPALATEYADRYARAQIRPERAAQVEAVARAMLAAEPRYRAAVEGTTVPWYVLGMIHQLEHSGRFTTSMTARDPIDTPPGEPVTPTAIPDDQWDATARQLLHQQSLDRWADWTIPGTLYQMERFNGFGYRPHNIPSPYLWAATDQYDRGKFVRAGVFDPTVRSAQVGAAAMLRGLAAQGMAL